MSRSGPAAARDMHANKARYVAGMAWLVTCPCHRNGAQIQCMAHAPLNERDGMRTAAPSCQPCIKSHLDEPRRNLLCAPCTDASRAQAPG